MCSFRLSSQRVQRQICCLISVICSSMLPGNPFPSHFLQAVVPYAVCSESQCPGAGSAALKEPGPTSLKSCPGGSSPVRPSLDRPLAHPLHCLLRVPWKAYPFTPLPMCVNHINHQVFKSFLSHSKQQSICCVKNSICLSYKPGVVWMDIGGLVSSTVSHVCLYCQEIALQSWNIPFFIQAEITVLGQSAVLFVMYLVRS